MILDGMDGTVRRVLTKSMEGGVVAHEHETFGW